MRLPSSLKALLIDFDGTLVQSTSFLYEAYEKVMKKRGLHPSKEEFSSLSGPTIVEASSLLQKKYALKEDPRGLYKEWKSILLPCYRNQTVCAEGAEEIFSLGLKVALVTSAEKDFVEAFLEKHPFQFDLLVCKEDYKKSKPDPEPYLTALKKLKISASFAIAIEDSYNGALSAVKAGVYTFVIGEKSLLPETHSVKSLADAVNILKKTL